MRYGIQAAELKLKLRVAGVQYVTDVKRAVLEQNGQLNIVQFGKIIFVLTSLMMVKLINLLLM